MGTNKRQKENRKKLLDEGCSEEYAEYFAVFLSRFRHNIHTFAAVDLFDNADSDFFSDLDVRGDRVMEEEFQSFGYQLPYKRYEYCRECDNRSHQFSNYGDYIKYSLDRNRKFIEQVNSDLEKFMRDFDNEHGTMLTPVGAKRIKEV